MDNCSENAKCIESTKAFAKQQNAAERLASVSRRDRKDYVQAAQAAAGAMAGALVALGIAYAAAITIIGFYIAIAIFAVLMGIAIGMGITAAVKRVQYNQSLEQCEAAKAAMSAAYDQMIEDCGEECVSKNQFDCAF